MSVRGMSGEVQVNFRLSLKSRLSEGLVRVRGRSEDGLVKLR